MISVDGRWRRFIAILDRAKIEGRPIRVFGLVGRGAEHGFYKLYARVGGGKWWRATASGFCQVSGDPQKYQKSLKPDVSRPSHKVFSGGIDELLSFGATYNEHIGRHIEKLVAVLRGMQ